MLDQNTRAAITRAADFFAANPDARTTATLALDEDDVRVMPCDPKAVCWCALGRIAFELKVRPADRDDFEAVYSDLNSAGLHVTRIYDFNDDPGRSNDDVVQYLRELAA